MNRRKACFLSLAFLLGTAAAEFRQPPLYLLSALCGALFSHAVWREADTPAKCRAFWALAFFAAALCGHCLSLRREARFDAYAGKLRDGAKCLVRGEIYKKEKDERKSLFYLKSCVMQLEGNQYLCNHVLLYLDAGNYSVGETLCVKGTVQTFSLPSNEGNFNERAYYRSLNIDFKVAGEATLFASGKKSVIREGLFSLREKMKAAYRNAMPEEDAGVLCAMTLGDKGQMDAGRKSLFNGAGISHFYSISGLHVSVLGMALYRLLRRRFSGCLVPGLAASFLMIGYGQMIGSGVSASRAIGMFLLLMYAKCRGRSYDRATALSALAAVLAGRNPGLLHQAGFWLSFSAVAGVMTAEAVLARGGGGKEADGLKNRIYKGVRQALATGACIQIATVPVMSAFLYEIPVYAACLNLIVLPCMGVLLGLGIFGGAAGCVWPLLGKAALYPCHLILLLFERACEFSLELPNSSLITGRPTVLTLLLWYGAALAFLAVKTRQRRMPVSGLIFLLCFLLFRPENHAFEVDVLDVGQGDGIYICTGDGANLFLDGGSSDVKSAGLHRILPFLKCRGVSAVDYWFVSHCDADHVSGLCEIVEAGYRIKNLVVSEYMPEDAAWKTLQGLAAQARIPVLSMKKGDALRGSGGWSMTCLSFAGQGAAEDRNENSLALFFESEDLRAFFAGDIGTAQERALAAEWDLPDADLYKASHHGSDGSNSEEILTRLSPKMTVISCGAKNRYGHPGAEALARMRKAGGTIYETSRLGQIKIKGAGLEAEGFSMLK